MNIIAASAAAPVGRVFFSHYPLEAILKLKSILQGDYKNPQGYWRGERLQRSVIALRRTTLLMHTPFSLPWLQPGLPTPVPEEVPVGLQDLRLGQVELSQETGPRQPPALPTDGFPCSGHFSTWPLRALLCALTPNKTQM